MSIKFTEIGRGKWQAKIDGQPLSSAIIVGGNRIWQLRGQRRADTAAIFKTRLDAARYQLACIEYNKLGGQE